MRIIDFIDVDGLSHSIRSDSIIRISECSREENKPNCIVRTELGAEFIVTLDTARGVRKEWEKSATGCNLANEERPQ